MSGDYEAAVVGGGIVGSSVAYHLARAGVETVLFDRSDEGRATDAGAGIVSPATSSRSADDAWFAFGVRAAAYYHRLVDALEAAGQTDHGYATTALLSVAADSGAVPAFEEAKARTERRIDAGDISADAVAEIGSADARELFPPLGECDRVLRYDGVGRVDGRRFEAALRAAAVREGAVVRGRNVTDLVVDAGRARGVVVDGDRIAVESVVVAGGAWSPAFADALGTSIPVEPHRGQIVHLDAGDETTDEWPLLGVVGGYYMVPWPDGRVAVGATREAESGYDPRVTAGGLREVLSAALRVAPGLGDATHLETRVGLRPASADGLPVLGAVSGVDGAFLATGHGATGLQLGPYSGKLVADRVRGVDVGVDLEPFSVARFG
ncbi:NAD(P)/FAD-dependent oxidoreductase [Haloferacaceae archaeon DSL9]